MALDNLDQAIFDKGSRDGSKFDQVFDPSYKWSNQEKQIYRDGFNKARDERIK